jgi:hypothetical protein
MNTTTQSASQDSISGLAEVFPQALIDKITGLSREAISSLILDLFDAGAICAATAENWLTAIEQFDI